MFFFYFKCQLHPIGYSLATVALPNNLYMENQKSLTMGRSNFNLMFLRYYANVKSCMLGCRKKSLSYKNYL